VSTAPDERAVAQKALELVCSRGDLALAGECYAEEFADHVNGLDFQGMEGIRRSTSLYRSLFSDLEIQVLDQVSEGDRVTSRWRLRGTNRGREVTLSGITISRFEDGRIVEDWSAFDSVDLLRGLGILRGLLAAPRLLAALRGGGGPDELSG
jgi:predicted ester cyclase